MRRVERVDDSAANAVHHLGEKILTATCLIESWAILSAVAQPIDKTGEQIIHDELKVEVSGQGFKKKRHSLCLPDSAQLTFGLAPNLSIKISFRTC
jgi:hypothetical protein